MASLTIENYVKTVYQTCARQGNSPAGTGRIATALGVSPGTVTSMLKTLNTTKGTTHKEGRLPCHQRRLTALIQRELGNDEIESPHLARLVRSGTTSIHAYNQGGFHGAVCVCSESHDAG
jgi:hypothetical protein